MLEERLNWKKSSTNLIFAPKQPNSKLFDQKKTSTFNSFDSMYPLQFLSYSRQIWKHRKLFDITYIRWRLNFMLTMSKDLSYIFFHEMFPPKYYPHEFNRWFYWILQMKEQEEILISWKNFGQLSKLRYACHYCQTFACVTALNSFNKPQVTINFSNIFIILLELVLHFYII